MTLQLLLPHQGHDSRPQLTLRSTPPVDHRQAFAIARFFCKYLQEKERKSQQTCEANTERNQRFLSKNCSSRGYKAFFLFCKKGHTRRERLDSRNTPTQKQREE
ncbi:hypothetical protein V6Z11_A01G117900 [Gossypium hirsutum]